MTHPDSDGKEVEALVRDLQSLGRMKPLSSADIERAREIMINLKKLGYTNKQIAEMSDGGWSESTVKNYTTGVRVSDAKAKEQVTSLLTEAIKKGVTLEEIRTANALKDDADRWGVDLSDLSQFASDVNQANENPKAIIQFFGEIKGRTSVEQLRQTQNYKDAIEKLGYSPENLQALYEGALKLGEFSEVMKILASYGTLVGLEEEHAKANSRKNALDKDIEDRQSAVKGLIKERSEIEGELAVHEKLREEGYDGAVLTKLSEMSASWGGVKVVIGGMNSFGDLRGLETKLKDAEKKLQGAETQLKKAQADNAHLMPTIGMCRSLLYEHNFTIDSIEDIYRLAERYGQPLEVLRIVGKVGEAAAVQRQIEGLAAQKGELEKRISALKKELEAERGLLEELKGTARGVLEPFTQSLTANADLLGKKYREAIDGITSKYEEYLRRFGELKGEAGRLEEELKLARIVSSIMNYPTAAVEIPLDYAILMLRGITGLCQVRGFNPKISAGDSIKQKYYPIPSYVEVELIDLLEWTSRGLIGGIKGG